MDELTKTNNTDLEQSETTVQEQPESSPQKPRKAKGTDLMVQIQEGLTYEQQFPNFSIKLFLYTVLFWIMMMMLMAMSSDDAAGFFFFTVGAYWLLIRESFRSHTLRYLKNIQYVENTIDYINRIRERSNKVSWTCRCYHHETQWQWVTENYIDYEWTFLPGELNSEYAAVNKTRQVKKPVTVEINKFRGSRVFSYESCKDISGKVTDDILKFAIVKLQCSHDFELGNSEIAERYNREQDSFIREHQGIDQYFQWSAWSEIPGYKSELLSLSSPEDCPLWLGQTQYKIAIFLGLAWFYGLWLEYSSVNARYHFKKQIS